MDQSYELYAVYRLIQRYDYDGATEILENILHLQNTSFYTLVLSCQRAVNFNFLEAKKLTDLIPQSVSSAYPSIHTYIQELPLLIKGDPHPIFNELMDQLVIQLEREAYTDFLGRIFQLRELLYKYAVIEFKLRQEYSLRDRIYQKKAFEHQFKIYRGLLNGIKEILIQGGGRWKKIVDVLSGKKMGDLMDIRHRTIVAHGIETATLNDIERIYGSTEEILEDLARVFQWLNIPMRNHKYKAINLDLEKMFTSLAKDT
ncbi:hypothetical protein [Ammoniphilus sp. CFH 90114]|uniref:hypothetical protein n=1 Tax=Ammoniphilus sp. CFH 90114 TaxID=2493665 RepID=UPI00100EE24C|nr:hypothetical protein [Ammoniphilus sp. CFH 90114]RXT14960.1 hypothetical protein EIZ39_01760 [Ammoniphilus sp. CFH 90114]